jgi:hypothetical protein
MDTNAKFFGFNLHLMNETRQKGVADEGQRAEGVGTRHLRLNAP